jgi:hypothetical protein
MSGWDNITHMRREKTISIANVHVTNVNKGRTIKKSVAQMEIGRLEGTTAEFVVGWASLVWRKVKNFQDI